MAKQPASTPQGKAVNSTASRPARPKPSTTSAPREGVVSRANRAPAGLFFQQSWAELKKVTWPTRQETINLTIAVIAMTLAIAAFLGLIDAGLDKVVQLLIGGK